MFEGLVSAEGAALYQCLLEHGVLSLDEEAERQGLCIGDDRVQELLDHGLAFEVAGERRLVPQAPIAAFHQLLSERQRYIDTELDALARDYRRLEQAQRAYTRSRATAGELAKVLVNPDEIAVQADDLRFSACRECLLLEPLPTLDDPHFQNHPIERRRRGVRYRSVWAREWLETSWASSLPDRLHEMGEEARFLPGLSFRMRIADDHAALVALLPQALESSLLVQAPHFVAALRQLFEYLWEHAEPISGNKMPYDRAGPTDSQRTVLRLLAAGLKDEAIARAVGVSVKTVRRHVADLLHRLGADTRFAAGAEAARRGWLTY